MGEPANRLHELVRKPQIEDERKFAWVWGEAKTKEEKAFQRHFLSAKKAWGDMRVYEAVEKRRLETGSFLLSEHHIQRFTGLYPSELKKIEPTPDTLKKIEIADKLRRRTALTLEEAKIVDDDIAMRLYEEYTRTRAQVAAFGFDILTASLKNQKIIMRHVKGVNEFMRQHGLELPGEGDLKKLIAGVLAHKRDTSEGVKSYVRKHYPDWIGPPTDEHPYAKWKGRQA